MAEQLLAIQVEDVNGDPVPNATIAMSSSGIAIAGTTYPAGLGGSAKTVFDLGTRTIVSIDLDAQGYFKFALVLQRDPRAGTLQVQARSPIWGLFTEEVTG